MKAATTYNIPNLGPAILTYVLFTAQHTATQRTVPHYLTLHKETQGAASHVFTHHLNDATTHTHTHSFLLLLYSFSSSSSLPLFSSLLSLRYNFSSPSVYSPFLPSISSYIPSFYALTSFLLTFLLLRHSIQHHFSVNSLSTFLPHLFSIS